MAHSVHPLAHTSTAIYNVSQKKSPLGDLTCHIKRETQFT